jgi:hypothetical protein
VTSSSEKRRGSECEFVRFLLTQRVFVVDDHIRAYSYNFCLCKRRHRHGRNNKTNHKRYFDFFEEAFNYIAYKGYIRMPKEDESEWMDTMNAVHASVKGGMK